MALSKRHRRLKALVIRCADSGAPESERLAAASALSEKFHPHECSADFADLLSSRGLPAEARSLLLRILFAVGDRASIEGLSRFIRDRGQPELLRTAAVMLLIRIDGDAAREAVAEGMPLLMPFVRLAEERPAFREVTLVFQHDSEEESGEPQVDRDRVFREAFQALIACEREE